MIELLWQEKPFCDYKALLLVNNVLAWLAKTLAEHEEFHDIIINGYLVARDEQKISTLILCDIETQKRLLQILQQPPEEYKEKYVPCILSHEPDPVNPPSETDSEDDTGEIALEVEKT